MILISTGSRKFIRIMLNKTLKTKFFLNKVFGQTRNSDSGFSDQFINLIHNQGQSTSSTFDPRNSNPVLSAREHKFTCPKNMKSSQRPTSVHKLMPGDIEVIAAMGDSLTAANGAKANTIIGVLLENRGVSWSIGGENCDITKLVTLPSMINFK